MREALEDIITAVIKNPSGNAVDAATLEWIKWRAEQALREEDAA